MSEPRAVECLRTAAAVLEGLSFDDVLPGELDAVRSDLNRVRGRFELAQAAFVRRVGELNDEGRAPLPDDEGARGGRMSPKEARRTSRNAEVLALFPTMADALGEGRVSMEHVDALAFHFQQIDAAARSLLLTEDADLAKLAGRVSVLEFSRMLRTRREAPVEGESHELRERRKNRARTWVNDFSGRFELSADVDPVMGARMARAIDVEVERMIRDHDFGDVHPDLTGDRNHLRAYALANLLSIGHQSSASGRRAPTLGAVTEVAIHVDALTLEIGEHARTVCELSTGQSIPVGLARRLICDAAISPVVINGKNIVLDVGRRFRLATEPQRTALRAMYRTCGHTHCETPFDWCEIHHIIPWDFQGPTDLHNLIPLCAKHHHQIHDHGWSISMDADRTLWIRRPDGHTETQPLRPLTDTRPGSSPPGTSPPGTSPPGTSPPGTSPPNGSPPGEQLTFVA